MIAVADPLPAASEAPAESVTPFPPTPVDVLTVHGAAGAKANS